MKNSFLSITHYFILITFFVLLISQSFSQRRAPLESDTVYLQVDMSKMVGSSFNPLTDSVKVGGTVNNDSIIAMKRIGTSYIYSLPYVLPVNGLYTYTFAIKSAGQLYYETADPSTRKFRVKDSTQTVMNFYNNYRPGWIPMIFDCDMYYQIKAGKFSPAIDYLDVSGNFNNWGSEKVELFARSTDNIYSCTIYYDTASIPAKALRFKFRFMGWKWDSVKMKNVDTILNTELEGDSNRIYYMTINTHHFSAWYDNIDPNVPSIPFVTDVAIQDSIFSKHTVTGIYRYENHDLKPEGISRYQWYYADSIGGTITAIKRAKHINFVVKDTLLIIDTLVVIDTIAHDTVTTYDTTRIKLNGRYLIFEVTPVTILDTIGLPVQAWSPTRITGVGIGEEKPKLARVYPNPVQDILKVDFLMPVKAVEMMTIIGKQFSYTEVNGMNSITIDISRLAPGIYILRVIDNQNSGRIYKIIKE